MKYSKTAITQLTRWYKSVLTKCAILNAVVFASMALATPAGAYVFPANGSTVEGTIDEMQVVSSGREVTFDSVSASNINETQYSGAAIENIGTSTISADSTFTNNSAPNGGAIYNAGTMTTGGTFSSNTASNWGGAIYNSGNLTISDNATFTDNKSGSVGGAIANALGTSVLTLGANVTFTGNEAVNDGGAIGNYKGAALVNGTTFTSNKAQTGTSDENAIGGGAMSLGAESTTQIANATFTDNTSGFNGGAIGTRNALSANNSAAKLDITNSTFTGNKALGTVTSTFSRGSATGGNGGAIDNHFYNSDTKSGYSYVGNSQFTNNEAVNGGAIYNNGTADRASNIAKMYVEDSTFTGNTASSEGGAIWNGGTLSLAGTNTFTGNTAGGKANDIHNNGTLNVDGTLELDGGITGTGTTTVASGATMNIGTATVENQDITFESGSTLGLKINSADEHGLIKVSGNFKNTGATLNPTIANGAYSEGLVVTLIEGSNINDEFNYSTQNGLYTFEGVGDGTYKVTKKSTEEISESTNATQNQANALDALTSGTSDNEEFNQTAETISELAQSGDSSKLRQALEAVTAMSSDEMPIVHQSQTETANQIFNAITTRLAESAAGTSARDGVASGDAENGSIWLKTLYNHAHMDRDSSRKINGFSSDSMGIALGVEKSLNNNVKAGLGYAYTDTDIDSHARDVDVDTHTVFGYGEYRPSAWFVNGVLSYNWSDYDEHKQIMGRKYRAKYDVDTIGVQAMTGYDFMVDRYTLTPEAGLRYLHVDQDSTTDTLGTHISGDKADILTAVIGAKVTTDCDVRGYHVRPEARLAMTYDIHNDDATAAITLANGAAYNVTGRALKRLGGELGLGLTAEINDNIELSAGYEGRIREDYYDNSGMLKLKYNF